MTGAAGRRAAAAAAAGFVVGFLAVTALPAAPPARAYWTDTGTVTSGALTTWGLTNVACPSPAWGSNHVLSWSAPAGTSSVVQLTSSPSPSGLSGWTQASPRPGTPLTTTGTSATWGITTANPLETTAFTGTWTLTATPPAPAGGWSATRSGTWFIDYDTSLLGTAGCAVS